MRLPECGWVERASGLGVVDAEGVVGVEGGHAAFAVVDADGGCAGLWWWGRLGVCIRVV